MSVKNIEKIGNVVLDYTYYPGEDLYSEGVAEDRLLDFVKSHSKSDYENYIQASRSWSTLYHLSHIRENVVSWLPIRENHKVLEIGSGCGAVTAAFARVAEDVTCVELSKKRSLINAYRNREFDNLTIMVGNFEDIEPNLEEKYDFITLIGVYEYAASYIHGEGDPYHRFLEILKKHLAPDGKIVIAIENRLGLKYFAGCKEDHLGQYFAGITGYTEEDGVKTFSKALLSKYLQNAGLHYRYYYPYPDYKLPHTIYSDDKLPGVGDLNTNLRNFDADRIVLFDEEKAFDTFIDEGVFPEYSNSFVVMACPDEGWENNTILPIYAKYANERLPKYRVSTLIANNALGEKNVFKRALTVNANEHIVRLCDNYKRLTEQYGDTGFVPAKCQYIKGVERGASVVGVEPKAKDIALFEYLSGVTLEDYLKELDAAGKYEKMEAIILEFCRKLNNTTDTVEFKRTPQFDEMFGKREFSKNYTASNPCNFDMIFSNIVLDKDKKDQGEWKVLDYEWMLDFPVPIQFVIYRAIYYHFKDTDDNGFAYYLSQKGMDVYSLCGIDIGERLLFEEMENTFQVYIIGGAASLDVMRVLMPSTTMQVEQLIKSGSYLRNLDTPKIYFSRGKNFTEENQLTIIGKAENNEVNIRIPVERYLASLRVDPTECPCVIHMNSIRYVYNDGTKQVINTMIANGYAVSDRTLLFNTNDPQLVMEDIPSNVKSVEISYVVTMLDKLFFDELYEQLEEARKQRVIAKTKFAYRVKRKIGIIKEDVLPEGYERIIFS